MSSVLLRKPTIATQTTPSRYACLGLKENPFPQEPTLVPTSPDPRVNGEIYCDDLHSDKAQLFRELLVPTSDRRPLQSIVFLMDAASRRGRGIGKTAFLRHQRKAIMADLGEDASGGAAVLFAAHVIPTASPSCRKFWEFCRLLFETLADQKIISLALWRMRGLFGDLKEEALRELGGVDQWEDTIGNDAWLVKHDVNVWEVNRRVTAKLIEAGIPEDFVNDLVYHGVRPADVRSRWAPAIGDAFWRKKGAQMVFDWLVRLFRAAEFTRGLLLIDELEKIVYHQNVLERRTFVESLRYYLIDGDCQNARERFYGALLTIHPVIQEMLLAHWQSAGLDRLAPLNEPEAKQCTLYFPPLDKKMSLPLVKVYLDYYRENQDEPGNIKPFTEEAVVEALIRSSGVPGKTLNLLHRVVEKAAKMKASQINQSLVEEVASASDVAIAEEREEFVSLPTSQVRLSENE